MTITPVMLIHCDAEDQDDCPLEGAQGLPSYQARTKAEAWKIAKSQGWQRCGTRHYCPHCAKKLRPAPEVPRG